MKRTLYLALILLVVSCGEDPYAYDKVCTSKDQSEEGKDGSGSDTINIISDYDMSTVDAKDRNEFKENLAKIEKEHGEQWDFCTCVIKNDSINKAFMGELSDAEFDRLSERFDVIDQHCKAFLTQSSTVTPEERAIHEKKVKKCLKEAGIK